ncbi:MAG: hypothetical protein Q9O62_04635 [Ardenticatenia bacterium]|nr:hypothetical protein [Ardenticatenia bacterium]
MLAEQAAARFRAAVETDKANSQAYRWLGRASLLLDDPEAAVLTFSAYARLRPKNPLGWWELGLAYERLGTEGGVGRLRWRLPRDLDGGGPVGI